MKTMFSADPFSAPVAANFQLSQGAGCVLIGTETHPSDQESLFQRTTEKYQGLGWTILRQETGRIFYEGTADETREANLWACPPDYRSLPEMVTGPVLGQVRLAGARPPYARRPGRNPFAAPALGQVGVVGGFGGPGGFAGGPGGLVGPVGPVAGAPSPESGPITGPSIPCGPAGYGPTCAWPPQATTVVQKVYPIDGVLGSGRGGMGARGRAGGEPYFQKRPW